MTAVLLHHLGNLAALSSDLLLQAQQERSAMGGAMRGAIIGAIVGGLAGVVFVVIKKLMKK
jgi:hypothetical protein